MNTLDKITFVLVIIGGLNWLLVGLFRLDLVASITGSTFGQVNFLSMIIYMLVGFSAIYQAVMFSRMYRYYGHRGV